MESTHAHPITLCRPVALGPGGTDQLAHALGQTRVRLGANMVGVAQMQPPPHVAAARQQAQVSPAHPDDVMSGEQDVVVFFGIVDFLQVRSAFLFQKSIPARSQ